MQNAAPGQVQMFGPGITNIAHREVLEIRAKEPRVIGLFKLLRRVPRPHERDPIVSSFRQNLVPALKEKGFERDERLHLVATLTDHALPEEQGTTIIKALMNGAKKEEIRQLLPPRE